MEDPQENDPDKQNSRYSTMAMFRWREHFFSDIGRLACEKSQENHNANNNKKVNRSLNENANPRSIFRPDPVACETIILAIKPSPKLIRMTGVSLIIL